MDIESGQSLMVVHEDDALRRAIAQVLRSEGLRVATFPSLRVFLDAPPAARPGCVLFGLPPQKLQTNIIQEQLYRLSNDNALVVLCSGPGPAMSLRARAGGRFQVLDLPINPQMLLAAIHSARRSVGDLPASQAAV